eukprot:2649674-Heterocapsa_arctica.AAC.1
MFKSHFQHGQGPLGPLVRVKSCQTTPLILHPEWTWPVPSMSSIISRPRSIWGCDRWGGLAALEVRLLLFKQFCQVQIYGMRLLGAARRRRPSAWPAWASRFSTRSLTKTGKGKRTVSDLGSTHGSARNQSDNSPLTSINVPTMGFTLLDGVALLSRCIEINLVGNGVVSCLARCVEINCCLFKTSGCDWKWSRQLLILTHR